MERCGGVSMVGVGSLGCGQGWSKGVWGVCGGAKGGMWVFAVRAVSFYVLCSVVTSMGGGHVLGEGGRMCRGGLLGSGHTMQGCGVRITILGGLIAMLNTFFTILLTYPLDMFTTRNDGTPSAMPM